MRFAYILFLVSFYFTITNDQAQPPFVIFIRAEKARFIARLFRDVLNKFLFTKVLSMFNQLKSIID